MLITSTNNSRIKNLRTLYKDKKARNNQCLFVCEGINFVKDIPKKYLEEVFVKESEEKNINFLGNFDCPIYIVKDSIFDAVADTQNPSGIIAVVKKNDNCIKPKGELVLLLCGLTDLGNIGTIIRTASARGVKSIVFLDCADVFSPKSIRATMGGIFYVDCIFATADNVFEILENYNLVSLDMNGESIFDYKKEENVALCVGSEAHGVPKFVRDKSKTILSIPMEKNSVESLNAAVSISIAMYVI